MARGQIIPRGKSSFRVMVYAGRDPVTRKERRLTGTARSRREAEKLLTRLLSQLDEQRRPATGATLGYLLDRWLETVNLELTTRHTYEGYINRTIRPVLGDLKLVKLTVDVLDRYYADLRKRGGVGDRPMGAGTVRKIHFILRAALNLAVRWQWLPSNPAALASPPPFIQKEVHPPTPEDVAKLIEAAWAADPDFGALLWLAMTTGARRGELCGLRWRAVRLAERDLVVSRSYVQRGGQRQEKDTKTHQSRRLALDEVTVAVLTEHLERCRAHARVCGVELAADAFVFSLSPDGRTPLLPDSVSQRFRRLAERVGISTTLHSFGRHFSATQLLAGGVDVRTVAGRLGHGGGGATTLRVYSHFVAAADRRAAELLGKAVPRPGQQG
ncbi:MAG TPA: site-specific integrase [Actinomycetes bacterium]|nr:site-specific integrase [Actinomycetes bacterium]